MTAVRGVCRGDDDAGARRLTARGFGELAEAFPSPPSLVLREGTLGSSSSGKRAS